MIETPSTFLTDIEPEPQWLIPNVLYKGDQVLHCGLPGTGKSYFLQDLTWKGGAGLPIIGPAVPPFRVLYFDEENGPHNWKAYARWLWRGLGCPDRTLLDHNVRFASFDLISSDNWGDRLCILASKWKPDLIIIDTATPACHILNENDNGEASAASAKIRMAQAASGPDCACLIGKHLRQALDKNGRPTRLYDIRGAKAWKGACDAIWFHLRCPGGRRLDGFHNTYIRPEKGRAYGLQDEIVIKPTIQRGLIAKLDLTLRNRSNSEELENEYFTTTAD